ncbi:hypothetical protein DKM44_02195 [Deinococcus irradiatisoli]|uniref:Uncharacterized protein n=1 Tax=Deinococcus irradiatisoli TaxID=2202254 RepID=A0A2Z3JFQ3_9DEIO|nr:hypothetical protein [Deinococcus irradiatisoli]AWN22190.1 hypothetical protein DKM44_02195 [Deinococcus irradiatisoli]
MLRTDHLQRAGRPVSFSEALGAKEGEALELNTCASAVCGRCGAEPRLYTHTSPKGREVVIWIPVDHICRVGR